jgi:gas vesicle protein
MGNIAGKLKFFVYGLLIGLFFAPRSGAGTRKELLSWFTSTVQDTVRQATGQDAKSTNDTAQL